MRAFMERVKSLLRRGGKNQDLLRFGELELDPASGSARVAGESVPLTPKEYDLLLFLARTPNVVRSREEILHAVWNTDYYGDGRTVDTHVKNLRMFHHLSFGSLVSGYADDSHPHNLIPSALT